MREIKNYQTPETHGCCQVSPQHIFVFSLRLHTRSPALLINKHWSCIWPRPERYIVITSLSITLPVTTSQLAELLQWASPLTHDYIVWITFFLATVFLCSSSLMEVILGNNPWCNTLLNSKRSAVAYGHIIAFIIGSDIKCSLQTNKQKLIFRK